MILLYSVEINREMSFTKNPILWSSWYLSMVINIHEAVAEYDVNNATTHEFIANREELIYA